MSALFVLLMFVYVLVCVFLVLVVLLQQGKGADLAGAFGGGGSQTSFGPRTSTNIMHRLTTGFFILFVVLSMTLAIMQGKARGRSVTDRMETASQPVASQPLPAELPAGQPPADEGGPPPAVAE